MQPRNLNMLLGLAAPLMAGLSEATAQESEHVPDVDTTTGAKPPPPLEALHDLERRMLDDYRTSAGLTCNVPPTLTTYQRGPRRRSKRAQRARERGWR